MRFAVYASSSGNYFFREIGELLVDALRELGFKASLRDERDGFLPGAGWHAVVAPHEFFYLGAGILLRRGRLPESLLLVNTEQRDTRWFELARRIMPKARFVWDIDAGMSEFLAAQGLRARHLPLGFVPGSRLFKPVRRLPRRTGLFLPNTGIAAHADGLPWTARPIDLLFVGSLTPRREAFLSRAAERLSRFRSVLWLSDAAKPVLPGRAAAGTETMLGLAQRSKIVLNLHRLQARYFEAHRVLLHGIGQRALVVSEPCAGTAPFAPGRDFIEADLEELPEVLERCLADPSGRREARRIAARGYETLATEGRMSRVLAELVRELDAPTPRTPLPAAEPEPPREAKSPAPAAVLAFRLAPGKAPRVAVAVTLRNYERLVLPCLESVRRQTLEPLDLVVVDDASTDASARAARRWLARHGRRFLSWRLLRHRQNEGLARARNRGFLESRTESVFVLDADNRLYPSCLERLLAALDESKAAFAYSYLNRFGEENRLMNLRPWQSANLSRGNFLDAMALVRKDAWARVGGYRAHAVQGWEDFDFWLRLGRAGAAGVQVPEILAAYRVHMRSLLHRETEPQAWRIEPRFRSEFSVDFAGAGQDGVKASFALFGSDKLPAPVPGETPRREGKYLRGALSILAELDCDA